MNISWCSIYVAPYKLGLHLSFDDQERILICPSQFPWKWSESESRSVMSDSLRPHGLYSSWNSLGQNTGMGNLALLQWTSSTQGLKWGLLHCRRILYQLSYQGSPLVPLESHITSLSSSFFHSHATLLWVLLYITELLAWINILIHPTLGQNPSLTPYSPNNKLLHPLALNPWWNPACLSTNGFPANQALPGCISPLCLWAASPPSGLRFHSAFSYSLKQAHSKQTPLQRHCSRFSGSWGPLSFLLSVTPPNSLWNPWERTPALSFFVFRTTCRAAVKFSFGNDCWIGFPAQASHQQSYGCVSDLSRLLLATLSSLTELSKGWIQLILL